MHKNAQKQKRFLDRITKDRKREAEKMDNERRVSKKELNMLIMKLPSPIRDHSERSALLASFLVERLKSRKWFLNLGIDPQDIVDAVYYHDIGKLSIERDYHHAFYCTAPHRRQRYEEHVGAGIELIKEELLLYLPAYDRPTFEWCVAKAISEHHEELIGTGFPCAKDARGISIVGRITAIVDRFDNMLFVGALGTFDFDSAVSELKALEGVLDKRLISVMLEDIDALREYTKEMYEAEQNKKSPDTYGIKLEYSPTHRNGEKGIDAYRVAVKVNDAYFGMLKYDILAPIGEQSGQLIRFEKLAFKRLCEDLDSLWTPGGNIPNVIFRVSAEQFKNKEFYRYVIDTADSYEIEHYKICFSLVEADMVSSAIDWKDIMGRYIEAGFSFEISEMGDSLSMVPLLDELLISRVCFKSYFIEKVTVNTKTKAMLIGLVRMLESMGLDTAIDDVRKQTEKELLWALGINVLSGGCFGKPLTIEALRGDDECLDKEVEANG